MNTKLQEILADILTVLKAAADQVGTVAKEQLPILVQEYLAWGFWSNFLTFLVIVIAMSFAAWVFIFSVKRAVWVENKTNVFCFTTVASVIASVVLTLTFFVTGWTSAMNALKVAIAPRVYLLEQVAAMVK